jgi:hypothetical protein
MEFKQRSAARGDDGNDYEVCEYVSRIDTSTLDERSSIEGLSMLRTSTGLALNRLSKGRYQVVQTGVVLVSNDPRRAEG